MKKRAFMSFVALSLAFSMLLATTAFANPNPRITIRVNGVQRDFGPIRYAQDAAVSVEAALQALRNTPYTAGTHFDPEIHVNPDDVELHTVPHPDADASLPFDQQDPPPTVWPSVYGSPLRGASINRVGTRPDLTVAPWLNEATMQPNDAHNRQYVPAPPDVGEPFWAATHAAKAALLRAITTVRSFLYIDGVPAGETFDLTFGIQQSTPVQGFAGMYMMFAIPSVFDIVEFDPSGVQDIPDRPGWPRPHGHPYAAHGLSVPLENIARPDQVSIARPNVTVPGGTGTYNIIHAGWAGREFNFEASAPEIFTITLRVPATATPGTVIPPIMMAIGNAEEPHYERPTNTDFDPIPFELPDGSPAYIETNPVNQRNQWANLGQVRVAPPTPAS